MKIPSVTCSAAFAFILGTSSSYASATAAHVDESVSQVVYGTSVANKHNAPVGTLVYDGEFLETGRASRAAMTLPSTSVARLGANTIFNYTAGSNTVDLESGTILFCKPKDAPHLNIQTAAMTAGITGTTGFVRVAEDARGRKVYTFGLIEGHATAHAGGQSLQVGPGDIVEFTPGLKPRIYAYDVPRLLKSSPLLTKFKKALPNQVYIDKEIVDYRSDVARGFITEPSKSISYSGDIPILSDPAWDSASNAQGQPASPETASSPAPRPASGNSQYPGSLPGHH